MPYTPEHKKQSRERILESAARLFLCQGYEQTGIDQIMADAGMTRGAFYAHFKSKSDLYARAVAHAAAAGRLADYQRSDRKGREWLAGLLQGYLNPRHAKGIETPCPLAFLVTDVAIREPEVRRTYTRIYQQMNLIIRRHARREAAIEDDRIYALTALMIGGVALGRALDDPDIVERLLTSCQVAAERLLE